MVIVCHEMWEEEVKSLAGDSDWIKAYVFFVLLFFFFTLALNFYFIFLCSRVLFRGMKTLKKF